jgi:hypothetical protein
MWSMPGAGASTLPRSKRRAVELCERRHQPSFAIPEP